MTKSIVNTYLYMQGTLYIYSIYWPLYIANVSDTLMLRPLVWQDKLDPRSLVLGQLMGNLINKQETHLGPGDQRKRQQQQRC